MRSCAKKAERSRLGLDDAVGGDEDAHELRRDESAGQVAVEVAADEEVGRRVERFPRHFLVVDAELELVVGREPGERRVALVTREVDLAGAQRRAEGVPLEGGRLVLPLAQAVAAECRVLCRVERSRNAVCTRSSVDDWVAPRSSRNLSVAAVKFHAAVRKSPPSLNNGSVKMSPKFGWVRNFSAGAST